MKNIELVDTENKHEKSDTEQSECCPRQDQQQNFGNDSYIKKCIGRFAFKYI